MIKTTREIVVDIVGDKEYPDLNYLLKDVIKNKKVWVDRDKLIEFIQNHSSFEPDNYFYRIYGSVDTGDLLKFLGVDEE